MNMIIIIQRKIVYLLFLCLQYMLTALYFVHEMKKRCDGKREIFEDLMKKQKEKVRLRNNKGECFPGPPLKEAHNEYDEEANVFVFRMKSLKQGQSRSFLTQASRHHAAQLYFFKKAVGSLEAIEPHVRLLAEQHHIDYQFSGLHDDMGENYDDEDDENSFGTPEEGELSFDYGQNGPVEEVSTIKNSMEQLLRGRLLTWVWQQSKWALVCVECTIPSGAIAPSGHLCVLNALYQLEQLLRGRLVWQQLSGAIAEGEIVNLGLAAIQVGSYTQPLLKESNNPTTKATPLPPPFSEGLTFKQLDPNVASYAKKAKRQAFSGPLSSKPWLSNPNLPASGPIATELHELPRPPAHLISSRRPSHSVPLISKRNEMSTASVSTSTMSTTTSALPAPPQGLPRSYSIPADGGLMEVGLRVPLEGSHNMKMAEDIASPPLTPITLTNVQPTSSSYR
ncbi:hypothetical protein MIMGU_mgv1a019572mg [Erythranthe guttata]|uniref:Uncharacterized protein n=1 Tax=Erythranthe guttata TaxID=4155 RepID=A0A022QIW3_ERYGU|nr:hypothetical protein MIMGU_mgv1a019572mg [Erythranthe guttata]